MKKYSLPLALVFCLFFLWAISSNLLPTMIRQLMKTCELNTFQASFIESAYCWPILFSYSNSYVHEKVAISRELFWMLLAVAGGLLFFPAAIV